MRILLFEDYSTLHTLLAKGLRELGHQVTLVGNGNMFHDLPRDIDEHLAGRFVDKEIALERFNNLTEQLRINLGL